MELAKSGYTNEMNKHFVQLGRKVSVSTLCACCSASDMITSLFGGGSTAVVRKTSGRKKGFNEMRKDFT